MNRTGLASSVFVFVLGACLAPTFAATTRRTRVAPKGKAKVAAARQATGSKADFHKQILPFTQKYCVNCHGPTGEAAGINFDKYKSEDAVVKDRGKWLKIADAVRMRHMPPKGATQPTDAERNLVAGWVTTTMAQAECGVKDPGRVTMRRLNRAEYNNTVRDLLGVDLHPADEFPSDDVGYGFDNIGDVLTISPILMEKYLGAADKLVAAAIVTPDPASHRLEAEEMPKETKGEGVIQGFYRLLVSNGEVWAEHEFPKSGEYVIRARAFEQHAGDEAAKMAFRVDGKDVQTVDVAAKEDQPKSYEVKAKLDAGKHKIAVAFLNDFYMRNGPPNNRDRNLGVDFLEIVGPLNQSLTDVPESHKRIFGTRPAGLNDEEYARRIFSYFASRAFRRPATKEEVERLVGIVKQVQKGGDSFERGVQLAVEAVLVSPHFLFRVELDPAPNNPKAQRSLNDYELASRLSYFLWSSMPDDELFALARKGQLKNPKVLEAQALRMLKDPKSQALVENFALQWLTLRNLQNVSPDPKLFPGFSDELRQAMLKETELFITAVVREDRSVMEFLDGKFTYLNERLAKHYGIPGVTGDAFQRVALTDGKHAGILTQGSILTVTSNPTRTSPVKRGKWVLEQMLGTPPPPPPPNVPQLEQQQGKLTGTLRQRMEQHRVDPGCASCHSRMDPIGFGLENFNAVGQWRAQDAGAPVDASGELPDGSKFNGPIQLIEILKKQKDQFTRNLTGQLLTYALGRGLEHYDQCAVGEITAASARKGYKFSALVAEIVRSEPFRLRRGDDGGER